MHRKSPGSVLGASVFQRRQAPNSDHRVPTGSAGRTEGPPSPPFAAEGMVQRTNANLVDATMSVADRRCLRHANVMGRDPAERTAPDLPTATASALPAAEEATESEPQRYVLPKNLRNAVKHLSDGELDLLNAATLEELKRRGRTPRA